MATAISGLVAVALVALALAGCGVADDGGTTVAMVTVPDVSGLTADDATARLCALDLALAPIRVLPGTGGHVPDAQINRRTRAVSSQPAAGSRVPVRTPVEVTVQSPTRDPLVITVPTCSTLARPDPEPAPAPPATGPATAP